MSGRNEKRVNARAGSDLTRRRRGVGSTGWERSGEV